MNTILNSLVELGQAANQVLGIARRMATRGDSRWNIDNYLRDSRACLLRATSEADWCGFDELLLDMTRAIRYAEGNGELVGALAVLAAVSSQEGSDDFRRFSLSAQQRVRAEIREHSRLGKCDPEEIKLGAELAMSSLQPLAA